MGTYDISKPDTWPDGLCSCGVNYAKEGMKYADHLQSHIVKKE